MIRRVKRIHNLAFLSKGPPAINVCPIKRKYHHISGYSGDRTYYTNNTYLKLEAIIDLFGRFIRSE